VTATALLGLSSLRYLPAASRPRIKPGSVPTGIVHLGLGAFHRAHQAVYTEDAIAAAGGDWGIAGVALLFSSATAYAWHDGPGSTWVQFAFGVVFLLMAGALGVRWPRRRAAVGAA